jgi:hypothetical protein
VLLGLMVELRRHQSGLATAAGWEANDDKFWCSKRRVIGASFIGEGSSVKRGGGSSTESISKLKLKLPFSTRIRKGDNSVFGCDWKPIPSWNLTRRRLPHRATAQGVHCGATWTRGRSSDQRQMTAHG